MRFSCLIKSVQSDELMLNLQHSKQITLWRAKSFLLVYPYYVYIYQCLAAVLESLVIVIIISISFIPKLCHNYSSH